MNKIPNISDTDKSTIALDVLSILAGIYREDSNALCAFDLTGAHQGNTPAIFVQAVAQILALTK